MAGPVVACVPHAGDVAHAAEARRVGRHDDHAGAAMGIGSSVGHGHHDRESGPVGRRGKPFAAVQDVVVALPVGGRSHPDRVRAGVVGLGHGEATADLASDQSGASQRSRCAGVPNSRRISMLPASGAWALNT